MKLSFIPLLVITLITTVAARGDGQKPITVAVFDFATTDASLREAGPKITALVIADLSADPHLALVERTELSKSLQEQALGLSGNITADAAATVGQMTGAKVLIAGHAFEMEGHWVLIANIIGTETSRLYVAKVEGSPSEMGQLASTLAQKIVQAIAEQSINLTMAAESREERITRILKGVKGDKRPTVLLTVQESLSRGKLSRNFTVENELGYVLQKAGLGVVDEKSDRKPDLEIIGHTSCGWSAKKGNLFPSHAIIEVKVLDRSTGKILVFDRQESVALDISRDASAKLAQEKAADELAGRLLPLLAQ
jgi:hypothetical protein